ncbi:MAG: hypothetical protein ACSHX9_15720 [Luteolibacter sp.]
MERFEIEDIVAQDAQGVVFRARMAPSGDLVAIRRFFPFGKDGEGLEKEEGIAFGIAASRLATLNHPALRRVIEGSIDPIDGIPYLVSEWIEGRTLPDVLSSEKLEPALVNDVMRLALEVSLVLSKVLGEEALWIETNPESVLVGDTESGRGFTFWISPFKWLGSDAQQRNLSGLVTLGECLAGWSNKLVSDQAGNGLGGWFKWLKANPDTGLRQAMESLAESTGNEPPPTDEFLVEAATAKPAVLIKQPSSKAPLLILGVISLLVLCAALAYLHKTAETPVIEEDFAKQEISEVIVVKEDNTAADPANSEKPDDEPEPKEPTETAPEAKPEMVKLNPLQLEYLSELKTGTSISLTGKLHRVVMQRSKTAITLIFAQGKKELPICAIAQKGDFKGNFHVKAFEPFVGKMVTVEGLSINGKDRKPRHIRIADIKDITLLQPPAPENSSEKAAQPQSLSLSPDDREKIEEFEKGAEVTLSGLFRTTSFSRSGKSLYLEFASLEEEPIRGVIQQSNYDGEFSDKAFTELIGKTITIKGTVFRYNFGNPAMVKVRLREDIVESP